VSPLVSPTLLDADVVLALLITARDDLELSALRARTLAGDVDWRSDSVRYVFERVDGIERRLSQLAAGADAAIADVRSQHRDIVANLEMLRG
jgi:hypothetical protein